MTTHERGTMMRTGQCGARAQLASALFALFMLAGQAARATTEAASASMAQAIATRIGTVPGLGRATAHGDAIVFSSSKLALSVVENESKSGRAHFHVLARLEGAAGVLDACIMGLGATPAEARASVVDRYVDLAFAPMAALIDPSARVEALPFSGDESYGVAGYRGFVGYVSASQGVDSAALQSRRTAQDGRA